MMKYVTGCAISAILSAAFTVGWIGIAQVSRPTLGQDVKSRGPVLSPPKVVRPGRPGIPYPDVFDREGLSPEESINVAVYENANKAVVNITTKSVRHDRFFMLEVPEEGTGSGSVLDHAGHILTNYHVIEGAKEVAVTMHDGNTYDSVVVGTDPINDAAVLRVDAPKEVLHPLEFGNSGKLRVGMRVFAIGNPFGLERTMTIGVISSLNRSLQIHEHRTIKSIIQIDAAINPGNSGGPLLDSHGRLIGINTAIASRTGQSSGVGFAIPVNLLTRVVPQLIAHGRVIRPEIGIQRVYETEQGLLIERMKQNGPAEKAGLQGPRISRQKRYGFVFERIDRAAADLIIAVDGQSAKTADEFLSYIESKHPGDKVEITVVRQGQEVRIRVELGGDQPGQPSLLEPDGPT